MGEFHVEQSLRLRRDRDSNPGSTYADNGFRDRPNRPLWHLSCKVAGVYKDQYAFAAEREGFEPPEVLPSTVFKTAAIDHSAISPRQK